ncbi:variable surface lipoprotein c [Lasius niger]|uniref:Variable surface lipoprotein c n=1 Tax=Lasius niger TaxID=67767 RepID=A0A0J7KIX8_LASNI|nr:variable surface lipoprotein c [Lasius niger]
MRRLSMSDNQTNDTVETVESQGVSPQDRTDAIKNIYGKEGIELGNKGEETFKERDDFDKAHNNASMVSKMVGKEKAEHDLSRSTPDTKADNA